MYVRIVKDWIAAVDNEMAYFAQVPDFRPVECDINLVSAKHDLLCREN